MKKGKQILVLLHRALLCLLAGAFLWGWIFTFLTDAAPEKKITLYADLRKGSWKEMAVALEKEAPAGIRFVQVRPFSYALMNSDGLRSADLYVMSASAVAEYGEWLSPVPEALAEAYPELTVRLPDAGAAEDTAGAEEPLSGILIFQAATGEGAAKTCRPYADERPGEDWYLCFGRESLHTGKADEAALILAEKILSMP